MVADLTAKLNIKNKKHRESRPDKVDGFYNL